MRLPTEAELAATYGVSRQQTVRRAFHDLVAEGLVERTLGRGTFVASHDDHCLRQFGSIDDLMGLSTDTRMELIDPLVRTVDLDRASRLQLKSDVVYALTLRRSHGSVPFCVASVNLPPAVGALLEDVPELTTTGATSTATVIGLLDTRLSEPIADAELSITAVPASPPVSDLLGCSPGEPLLRIDRTYLTAAGVPVELAVSHFEPVHHSYRVRLRRSQR